MKENKQGNFIYSLAKELFPICRSITGEGTRETLQRIKKELPDLQIHSVPSGTKVMDWTVPKEWRFGGGYIEDNCSKRIVDTAENNLHLVGYSVPVDEWLSLDELQKHLYSLPDQPDWIPYVTSYYKERWGFCMTQRQRDALPEGKYHCVVDTKVFDGELNYADLIIPGKSKKEIFFSSYVCHPSMANDQLSGSMLLVALAKFVQDMPERKYSYRFVWVPETIGSITYLSKNLDALKTNVVAGYNVACVGDDRVVSYLASRKGNTFADKLALNSLKFLAPDHLSYSFLERGSDERQYCAPGVDLPVCTVCRSMFHKYPEYHTSADNLDFISPAGLQKSFDIYADIISNAENNHVYRTTCLCEPQLGPRGLYPTESYKGSANSVQDMMNFIAYADGTMSLLEISSLINVPVKTLSEFAGKLMAAGLMEIAEENVQR